MKRKFRFISIILIICFSLTTFPLDALAKDTNKENSEQLENITPVNSPDSNDPIQSDSYINLSNEANAVNTTSTSKEAGIVGEVIEKREKNVKHFQKDDGTYEAFVYPTPVHYKDKNGKWEDIDNTLIEESDGETSVLSNRQNDFTVKFAENARSKELVSVRKDQYEISWNLYQSDKIKDQIKSDEDISTPAPNEEITSDTEETQEESVDSDTNTDSSGDEAICSDDSSSIENDDVTNTDTDADNSNNEIIEQEPVANSEETQEESLDTDINSDTTDNEAIGVEDSSSVSTEDTGVGSDPGDNEAIDEDSSSSVSIEDTDNSSTDDPIVADPDQGSSANNQTPDINSDTSTTSEPVGLEANASPAIYSDASNDVKRAVARKKLKEDALTKLNSTVDYKEIFANVDLQYQLNSDQLKEYIIINDRIDNPEFIFDIRTKNLNEKVMDDGSIIFCDKDDDTQEIFK